MKPRYLYLRDPVFLTSVALYFVNRFIAKPLEGLHGGFFHNWGNDLLCIPLFLPICLWFYRRIGLRTNDGYPTRFEMLSHLIVWSYYFVWAAPRMGGIYSWKVSDPWDVLAFSAGTAVAALFWSGRMSRQRVSPMEANATP